MHIHTEKKIHKPYLMGTSGGKFYGYIGTVTNLKDIHGTILKVGDIVKVHKIGYRFTTNDRVVVMEDGYPYVRGFKDTMDMSMYKFEVIKSYKDIKSYTIFNGIKYMIEPKD